MNLQNLDGRTALISAMLKHHQTVVHTLLNYPKIDLNLQTKKGESALSIAVGKIFVISI